MSRGLPRKLSAIRSALVIGFSILNMHSQAFSAQRLSPSDCKFVVHVPGFGGGNDLHYRVQKGAVFTENARHMFCGPVAQATPLGESNAEQCFTLADDKLISGSWSNKVTSSDCSLPDAGTMTTQFAVDDMAPWSGGGPSNLHGQAFLKTIGGDVKTCAGESVLLLPATPYVDEYLSKTKAGVSTSVDPQLVSFFRKTVCDAQGNFSFTGLPPARWYVLTDVTWGVPHVDQQGERPGPLASLLFGISGPPATDVQGGELLQAVTLMPGDNQALLTYRDEAK